MEDILQSAAQVIYDSCDDMDQMEIDELIDYGLTMYDACAEIGQRI